MELDRQGIERRDFPIVRRGYDPASVDAHLRTLAGEVEALRVELQGSGQESSLASLAGTQVQGIIEAAQATAATIERDATQQAQRVCTAADADAQRTREDAIAQARAHVAAVSQATDALLARVGSIDTETRALVDSLRSGAGRLASDLGTVEGEMAALYDAASGRAAKPAVEPPAHEEAAPALHAVEPLPEPAFVPEVDSVDVESADTGEIAAVAEVDEGEPGDVDLDGARLVALNMALNGDSREDTGRYLAENFEIAEPEQLLDEVYAAIEG